MRKRTTATERNRACDAINAYSTDLLKKLQNTQSCAFSSLLSVLLRIRPSGKWRGRERLGDAHLLTLAPDDGVQFASQQQQQTSQIHPREQHDDRRQREISRVVTIVSYHVQLEKFRRDDPADRKENCARQRLRNGQIVFRRQKVKRKREPNQRHAGQRQIQPGDPRLERE